MTRQDARLKLLQAGVHLTRVRGCHDTGLNHILAAASVPKGSFHHVGSKEDFEQLVQYYNDQALGTFRQHLNDHALAPRGTAC